MSASQGAVVVQLHAAKKKRLATNRRRFHPDDVHKRIAAQAAMLAWQVGRPDPNQYPDLAKLLSSALFDARTRRNRRRPMTHYYCGKYYRMVVEGFDRLVVYDINARRKLVSSCCLAL